MERDSFIILTLATDTIRFRPLASRRLVQVRTSTLIDLVLDSGDPPPSLIRASGFVSEDDLIDALSSDESERSSERGENCERRKTEEANHVIAQSPRNGKSTI